MNLRHKMGRFNLALDDAALEYCHGFQLGTNLVLVAATCSVHVVIQAGFVRRTCSCGAHPQLLCTPVRERVKHLFGNLPDTVAIQHGIKVGRPLFCDKPGVAVHDIAKSRLAPAYIRG